MGRIPRQPNIITDLQGQARHLSRAELLLTAKLSARIAQAEKATADATDAADAATDAADAATDAAEAAQATADALAETNVFQDLTCDGVVVGAAEVQILAVTIDANDNPCIAFGNVQLLGSPAAAGWKQITIVVRVNGILVSSRAAHIQGNADTQTVNLVIGVNAGFHPELIAPGPKLWQLTAQKTAEAGADPDVTVGCRTFQVLRIGTSP